MLIQVVLHVFLNIYLPCDHGIRLKTLMYHLRKQLLEVMYSRIRVQLYLEFLLKKNDYLSSHY